jgi:hypothetical protein
MEDSIIVRIETSRNTNDIVGSSLLDLSNDTLIGQSMDPIMQQQQQEKEGFQSEQQQEYVFDDIDMTDLGGMEDYVDMTDYD